MHCYYKQKVQKSQQIEEKVVIESRSVWTIYLRLLVPGRVGPKDLQWRATLRKSLGWNEEGGVKHNE